MSEPTQTNQRVILEEITFDKHGEATARIRRCAIGQIIPVGPPKLVPTHAGARKADSVYDWFISATGERFIRNHAPHRTVQDTIGYRVGGKTRQRGEDYLLVQFYRY